MTETLLSLAKGCALVLLRRTEEAVKLLEEQRRRMCCRWRPLYLVAERTLCLACAKSFRETSGTESV